jgi:hypothetical protein
MASSSLRLSCGAVGGVWRCQVEGNAILMTPAEAWLPSAAGEWPLPPLRAIAKPRAAPTRTTAARTRAEPLAGRARRSWSGVDTRARACSRDGFDGGRGGCGGRRGRSGCSRGGCDGCRGRSGCSRGGCDGCRGRSGCSRGGCDGCRGRSGCSRGGCDGCRGGCSCARSDRSATPPPFGLVLSSTGPCSSPIPLRIQASRQSL